MLVYITPIFTLIGALLLIGLLFAKEEKQRAVVKRAAKIVGTVIGVIYLIMIIGFISVFIRLNF